MIETLRELESLLRKHGYNGQADAVRGVLVAIETDDRATLAREATGPSLWGGAGSVADVDLRYGSPRPPAEAAADVPRFHRAMVALADQLESASLATRRTRNVASTFRRGWRRVSNEALQQTSAQSIAVEWLDSEYSRQPTARLDG